MRWYWADVALPSGSAPGDNRGACWVQIALVFSLATGISLTGTFVAGNRSCSATSWTEVGMRFASAVRAAGLDPGEVKDIGAMSTYGIRRFYAGPVARPQLIHPAAVCERTVPALIDFSSCLTILMSPPGGRSRSPVSAIN